MAGQENPISAQIKQEYTHKLMQAHLRVARLAVQLNRIDGADGKTPLPRGLHYGHIGDLSHLIELLDQAGDVLDEHVNGIVEMREQQDLTHFIETNFPEGS